MTKRRSVEARAKGASGYERFCAELGAFASNLYSWGMNHEEDAIEIRIKRRGPGDWLSICKRLDADGKPQVVFGSAFDFVSAVLAVNAAMSADAWKEDKPWKP